MNRVFLVLPLALLWPRLTYACFTVPVDSVRFTVAGRALLGDATDVVVDTPYAYVALTTGLMIADISLPDSPSIVSHIYLGGDTVSFDSPKLAKQGSTVYFVKQNLLSIVSVLNPGLPIVSGRHVVAGASNLFDVVVDSPYVYLGDGPASAQGIFVVRYSNGEVTPVARIPDAGDVRGMFLQNDVLYVANGFGGDLVMYSVQSPSAPRFLGRYDSYEVAMGVFVRDTLAFLANGGRGLRIVSVRNPSLPVEIGYYDPDPLIQGVIVRENYAFTNNGDEGFRVLDIANPSTPQFITQRGPGGVGTDLKGNIFYAAQPRQYAQRVGLYLFDISDPTSPLQRGVFNTGANYEDIEVRDSLIYVTGFDRGVQIVRDDDVYDPTSWRTLAFSDARRLSLGSPVSMLLGLQTVQLLDWTNPYAPVQLGQITMQSAWVQKAIARDSILYVAGGQEVGFENFTGELRIYNIADPRNPRLLGSFYESNGPFFDLALYGRYALVADYVRGIRVFDCQNPASPSEVGRYPGRYARLLVNRGIAYLIDFDSIVVCDISTPSQIRPLSSYWTNYGLREAKLRDDIIVAAATSQLLAFDVADSTRIRLAGFMQVPAYLGSIDVMTDKIYLTGYRQGVYVVRYDIVSTDVQVETATPDRFNLEQNYPNPFNPSTTINYKVPSTTRVLLTVTDVLGRRVQTLVDEMKTPGVYQARFNASMFSAGVYFCSLRAGSYRAARKMVLSK